MQYKITIQTELYNTTTGDYNTPQSSSRTVITEEATEGQDIEIVAGTGKVIANAPGTYYIEVSSSSETATMDLLVGTQSLEWKQEMAIILTGTSIMVDTDTNCSIDYKVFKLN